MPQKKKPLDQGAQQGTQKKRAKRPARNKPASAHDVARVAGVSRSAVSRTFTEGASVAPATRKRVLEAAKTLKYRPNLFARSLITNRSNIIGVAVSQLDNQHYPAVVQMLSEELAKAGYRILLFITRGSQGHDPVVDELLRYRLDALILASSSLSSALAEECRAAGVPVIMFNNVDTASDVASVAGTNVLGARTIAAYFAAAGHRRFGYISGVEGDSTDQERQAGFTSYLLEKGMTAPICVSGHFTFDGALQATRTLLNRPKPPNAIFCVNDHTALAALQVARTEFNLEPGKDISIVGFDNVSVAAWPCFSLTTYSQPTVLMVARTIELMRRALEHPESAVVHARVRGELIVRNSARVPRSGIVTKSDGTKIWQSEDD
ncbi:MAG: LacI family DNA-binding transcriptional regulator [Steroidobacteraceae bacterium]